MLDKQALKTILGIEKVPHAPKILIFSEKDSTRLQHVCGFIFNGVLNVGFSITTKMEEAEQFNGPTINYSNKKLKNTFQILPHALLFEKEVAPAKPKTLFQNGIIYFYKNDTGFRFDIFSAIFYLISRYEEWQDFAADKHGRFECDQSILITEKQHLEPVVDKWIIELKNELQKQFHETVFPEKEFKIISTIDVDNLFAYRSKGFIRTLGACVKDIVKLNFVNFINRLLVLFGKKKDPFDIYEEISDFCFEKKIPIIYFFLFKTGTKFDRTVNPKSSAFTEVFNTLRKNKSVIAIHPSYFSETNEGGIESEAKALSAKIGERVIFSRQHYLKFNIRTTPKKLIESGIQVDFSMGYATEPGFRAGTSFPFYYYDFNEEKSKDLLMVPFCAMDGAYTVYQKSGTEAAYKSLYDLSEKVRHVKGIFVTVFHERTFSDHLYKGFGTLYKKLLTELKQ